MRLTLGFETADVPAPDGRMATAPYGKIQWWWPSGRG